MKKLVMLLFALLIPRAFAETSIHEALHVHNDAATPSFVGRHIHGKCGDLDVYDHAATGTVQGHAIAFRFDRQSGVLTFTVDGQHTITGFTDAAGRLTELIDEHGNKTTPLTLSPEQARAAVERSKATLARMLDECGSFTQTAQTKACGLPNNNFDASGSAPSGEGVNSAGVAHQKSCEGDEESEDFWITYFQNSGAFDTPGFDPTLQCMQLKAACEASCEKGFNVEAVVCGMVAGADVIAGAVCAIADYAVWQWCINDCAAQYPC